MNKNDIKKKLKKDALLNTAFDLFTSQGINKTSISDIVEKAGVAKGTFYLYFKDKYEDERMLVFQLDVLTKAAFNFSFYDTYVTKDEMEKVFEFYNFDEFSRNYLSNLVKEINKTRKYIK